MRTITATTVLLILHCGVGILLSAFLKFRQQVSFSVKTFTFSKAATGKSRYAFSNEVLLLSDLRFKDLAFITLTQLSTAIKKNLTFNSNAKEH